MNKDEAERCINIAKRCIADGNVSKAEKFLKKSITLHETETAKVLLSTLHSSSASTSRGKPASSASASSSASSSAASSQNEPEPPPEKEFTGEMKDSVNKVKGKKDYYEILGVTKTATDSDLKKAYRKLALALHPDKNCAPGANEAFKAVGNAYAVLSNSDKRAHYDKYGLDEDRPQRRGRGNHSHHYHEEDISPEELFNMFFGGMQPARRGNNRQFYSNYNTRQNTDEGNASVLQSLLQMSPLLLLILMSVVNSIFQEDPVWSYHRNGNYKVERTTNWNNIKYFVKGDFNDKYTRQKALHVDYEIEKDYRQDLQIKCINNQRRREQLMYQFRVTGNTRYRDYADQMDLNSCKDYNNFKLPQYINP